MHERSPPPILWVAVAAAALVGCAGDGSSRSGGDPSSPVVVDHDSLKPARIMIHPLTRIGAGRPGPRGATTEALVLHLEVRDRFDQPIKALGRIDVGLFRPSDSAGASRDDSTPRRDRAWTIDLTNPRANADAYDHLVTRTYTLFLGNLPEWLIEWHRSAPTDAAGRLAPAIEVVFTTTDIRGGEYTLRTSFRLRR